MFKFDSKRFYSEELLGAGSSNVYPYQKSRDDTKWVVKHLMAKDDTPLLRIMDEIVLGFNNRHPAILPISGYFVEPTKPKGFQIFIKQQRMKESLKEIIVRVKKDSEEKFPEENIVKWLYTLLNGLEYLRKNKIPHRNIKPSNILIDQKGDIKLSDIRSTAFMSEEELLEDMENLIGGAFYSAPEILAQTTPLDKKDLYSADIWALGVSITELCLLRTRLIKPLEQNKEKIVEKIILEIREKYSDGLSDVLQCMLNVDKVKRISAKDALKLLESKYSYLLDIKQGEFSSESNKNNEESQKEIEGMQKKYLREISEFKRMHEVIVKEREMLDNLLQQKKQEVLKLNAELLAVLEQRNSEKEELTKHQNDLLKMLILREEEIKKLRDSLSLENKTLQTEKLGLELKSQFNEKEEKWFKVINKLKINQYLFIESEKYLHLRIKTKEFQNNDLQKFLEKFLTKLNRFESLVDLQIEFGEDDHEIMNFLSALRVSDHLKCVVHQKIVAHWLFNGNWTAKKIEKTIGPSFGTLKTFELVTDHDYWSQMIKGLSRNLRNLEELSLSIKKCIDKELEMLASAIYKKLKHLRILRIKSQNAHWIPYQALSLFAKKYKDSELTIDVEIFGKFLNDQSPSEQTLSEFITKFPRIKLLSYPQAIEKGEESKENDNIN